MSLAHGQSEEMAVLQSLVENMAFALLMVKRCQNSLACEVLESTIQITQKHIIQMTEAYERKNAIYAAGMPQVRKQ